MYRLFSEHSWTFPLEIRQRMAEDITNFGQITTWTKELQDDFFIHMNDQEIKDYQAGY